MRPPKNPNQTTLEINYQTFQSWYETLPANMIKSYKLAIIAKCGISDTTFWLWATGKHSPKVPDRNIINGIANRILTYPEKERKKKIQIAETKNVQNPEPVQEPEVIQEA